MIYCDMFNFYHYTIDSQHTGLTMRRVLHVGPCNTPGMSKVIEILSQNPPDGWVAETLQSHIVSNPIAKYFFHRSAIKQFSQIITGEKNQMLFTFIPLQIGLGEENPPMFLYVSNITCHAFYIFTVATSLIGLAATLKDAKIPQSNC